MRYLIGITLIASTVGVIAMQNHAAATTTWDRSKECRYQGLDGRMGFNVTEIRDTLTCFAHKFDVSAATASAVVERESRFYPKAVNSSSGACGLLQLYPASSFYDPRLDRVLGARPKFKPVDRNCLNARSNLLAGLWEARVYGWSAWGF